MRLGHSKVSISTACSQLMIAQRVFEAQAALSFLVREPSASLRKRRLPRRDFNKKPRALRENCSFFI